MDGNGLGLDCGDLVKVKASVGNFEEEGLTDSGEVVGGCGREVAGRIGYWPSPGLALAVSFSKKKRGDMTDFGREGRV